jgi:hypothetical protein
MISNQASGKGWHRVESNVYQETLKSLFYQVLIT